MTTSLGWISPPDYGNTGRAFPRIHIGATNSRRFAGVGVEASLGANATITLISQRIPNPLPTGTLKLVIGAMANATSGSAKVNPTWASLAAAENPDTITLTAEGTTTITWAAGDADDWKETEIILDADTPVVDERIVMTMVFETASWTLAALSNWYFELIWE